MRRHNIHSSDYNSKLRGKKYIYEIGTVVPLSIQKEHFILVAFSKMRPNGTSSVTKLGYTDFLCSLWKNLSTIQIEDDIINITVFGESSISGLPADFKFQDKLHEIIKSFLLESKNRKLCKKLRICMRVDDYKQFDYEDCKLLAAYFDSHLSQIENTTFRNKRGIPFKPD